MATGLIPSRQIICGGKCPFFDGNFNFTSKQEITNFVITFARFLTYLAVPIAIVMIIYSGFRIIFGLAEPKALINIIIGLAIIILAYTFTSGFAEILTNGVDINSLLR
jgi:ABC-type multidrug transport system permease subunit